MGARKKEMRYVGSPHKGRSRSQGKGRVSRWKGGRERKCCVGSPKRGRSRMQWRMYMFGPGWRGHVLRWIARKGQITYALEEGKACCCRRKRLDLLRIMLCIVVSKDYPCFLSSK